LKDSSFIEFSFKREEENGSRLCNKNFREGRESIKIRGEIAQDEKKGIKDESKL